MKASELSRRAVASVAMLLMCETVGLAQQPRESGDGHPSATLEDAARSLRKGVRQATEAVRASFSEMRDEVQGMSIQARVYGRLHWDKALADAAIEVQVEGGEVTLTGSVVSPAARVKAATLTRDTVGVTSVVDQLSIAKPDAEGKAATIRTNPPATTRP